MYKMRCEYAHGGNKLAKKKKKVPEQILCKPWEY